MNSNQNLKKLVMAALFTALTCVATMVIQIPSPMNGYVHMGDSLVLLSGWFLGPIYGGAAAGIGSMLADVFTGYAYYAPGTFVIKALTAIVAAVIAAQLRRNEKHSIPLACGIGAAAGEVLMVLGYWGYSGLILGKGLAAAASIPGNLVQGAFGAVSSILIFSLLARNKTIRKNMYGVL